MRAAPFGQRFAGLLRRLKLNEFAAMAELAPERRLRVPRFLGPGTAVPKGLRTGRVILLAGCAQQVLRPEINDATIRLFARGGIDVVVSAGAGCCGALSQHIGRESEAIRAAKANVDAWSRDIDKGGVDAIIINTSGCGTTVKDYGELLAHEPRYAERAKKISALAKDVTEFLEKYDIGAPKRWSSLKVAYHAACSLQHGQRVVAQPKALMRNAGFTVVDVPESHLCCGSAGVYNILQPEIAGRLKDRKVANIKELRPDIVAAGNIGCIRQLETGLDIPVIHTVELLDWAYGGPVPPGLEGLERYSTAVPQPKRAVEDYIGA
jgi:glycolate oxidase iron-sulfur subunit